MFYFTVDIRLLFAGNELKTLFELKMSKHSFQERFSAAGLKIASSNGYIVIWLHVDTSNKCVDVNEKYSCCFSGLASETQW